MFKEKIKGKIINKWKVEQREKGGESEKQNKEQRVKETNKEGGDREVKKKTKRTNKKKK